MRQRGVVAVLVAVALAIPAMAFAQETPWCGGAQGPEGTNFGECPRVHAGHQVAGPAVGMGGLERFELEPTATPDRGRGTQEPGGDSSSD